MIYAAIFIIVITIIGMVMNLIDLHARVGALEQTTQPKVKKPRQPRKPKVAKPVEPTLTLPKVTEEL